MLSSLLLMISVMTQVSKLVPILVIMAKFSISVAFCFLYFSSVQFFDTEYLGFVMGVMNVAGRLSTIAAPMIAEQKEPLPMLSCMILNAAAAFACWWLQMAGRRQ